jgi:3-oxoacyl-[acyl-carrier-protein] synthase II
MSEVIYLKRYGQLALKALDKEGNLNHKMFYQNLLETPIKTDPFDDEDSINHYVGRNYDITGPTLSISTACASSNSSIGEAFLKIQRGLLDIAICGGAYNFDIYAMIGFSRLGALSNNPDPETACRPFDKNRDGFVMGSGCGILILESLTNAQKRGADILAEISGYGYYSDAFRPTDPDPEAKGAVKTLEAALEMAGLNPEDIDYINAHGTSTKMNDKMETVSIKKVFKSYSYSIPVSSTKSMIGHSIMAAGALEGIACINSICQGVIHPTRNWKERDPELDLDYVPDNLREKKINHVISNNFGFGGQNVSIIYSRFNG